MHDHSTLDLELLAKLAPAYVKPPTYELQKDPGNGCFLDPPGYPTYFSQSVYTAHGDTPPHDQPHAILLGRALPVSLEKRDALFRRIYKPLPFDHPRVQAWVAALFVHFRGCYRDEERHEHGKPGILIWPVPYYQLKTPVVDPKWQEKYKDAAIAEAEAFNEQERTRAARIAIDDNHLAVRAIREVYPDYQPRQIQVRNAHGGLTTVRETDRSAWVGPASGDWWERHAERPTPDKCVPPSWYGPHKAKGRCQFCGSVDGQQEPQAVLA